MRHGSLSAQPRAHLKCLKLGKYPTSYYGPLCEGAQNNRHGADTMSSLTSGVIAQMGPLCKTNIGRLPISLLLAMLRDLIDWDVATSSADELFQVFCNQVHLLDPCNKLQNIKFTYSLESLTHNLCPSLAETSLIAAAFALVNERRKASSIWLIQRFSDEPFLGPAVWIDVRCMRHG